MSHVALDNRREDPEPVIIVPYFPRGLAKSTEQNTEKIFYCLTNIVL